ncbi:MAG: phospholipase D-like domain-containing protein [bacterium]
MRIFRIVLTALVFTQLRLVSTCGGVEADVRDISGGKYFDAVHMSFREAVNSIHVAMYEIRLNPDRKSGPHYRLLQDLVAAQKRGVKVKVYLDRSESTDQDRGEKIVHDANSLAYGILKDAGVDVSYVVQTQRLHAKLIVIDERMVVESSANWSFSAMTENAESGTIIVSQQYAAQKLQWIAALKLQKGTAAQTSSKKPDRSGR